MPNNVSRVPSRLLNELPALYQEDAFLGQFLLAFEKILLGRADDVDSDQGLEATIASLATLFDPRQTPEDFLPWLATWTAFSLRADLDVTQQRSFLANIIPLYRRRGTKKNLQDLLTIFSVGTPTVIETDMGELQLGVHSTIGEDTYLQGGAAHFFQVTISLPEVEPAVVLRQREIARALIELEKPAHTQYTLIVESPSMQIGQTSSVGIDTLLGTLPASNA